MRAGRSSGCSPPLLQGMLSKTGRKGLLFPGCASPWTLECVMVLVGCTGATAEHLGTLWEWLCPSPVPAGDTHAAAKHLGTLWEQQGKALSLLWSCR